MRWLRSNGNSNCCFLESAFSWYCGLPAVDSLGCVRFRCDDTGVLRRLQDVDDLENVAELEVYVAQSNVVLMFLSQGYFGSRNCTREVVATLDQMVPCAASIASKRMLLKPMPI